MSEYLVRWEIDEEADSPEEAARQALARLRNPETCATVFDVRPKSRDDAWTRVDLDAIDHPEEPEP